MTKERLLYLARHQTSLSQEEKSEWQLFVADEKNKEGVMEVIAEAYSSSLPELELSNAAAEQILEIILTAGRSEAKVHGKVVFFRWLAAACIIGLIGIGAYLLWPLASPAPDPIAAAQRYQNDVAPGSFKAKLTLDDGSVIVLDSAKAGELAKQGKTIVMNKDGQLVYQPAPGSKEVLYNTLTTARGETYSTVLADGTKVWLNAASSIRFPTVFNSNERRVEITGEAYFEVETSPLSGGRAKKRPFIVSKDDMEVKVLGTHFNVNAYDDEEAMKVTLLEGSVIVNRHDGAMVKIKPGEQAVVRAGVPINVLNPDLGEVMAWKDGRFLFKSAGIKLLMRQLSRWYDVDVLYENVPATGFTAKIGRNTPISSILKALELTGEVKFRIEGKRVVVMH